MASLDETLLPPVNWGGASRYARLFGGGGPNVTLARARQAVTDVEERAHRAVAMVSDHSGLVLSRQTTIRAVDRPKWSAANIAGLRELAKEVDLAADDDESFTANMAGAQVGTLLAFLSSRVLGQYEPFSREGGQLLFVVPNIVGIEQRLNFNPGDFRMWIALHEATHLLQFQGVPWLREYFLELVRNVVSITDTGNFLKEACQRLSKNEPNDELGLLGAVAGEEQRRHLESIQALMSLLEGHAEAMMDTIGATEIVSVETLRRRFNRYRSNPGSVTRVIRQLLGLDVKYSQYLAGKKFVDDIIAAEGIEGFNRIWDGPDSLPTLHEIRNPSEWRERTGA